MILMPGAGNYLDWFAGAFPSMVLLQCVAKFVG